MINVHILEQRLWNGRGQAAIACRVRINLYLSTDIAHPQIGRLIMPAGDVVLVQQHVRIIA